MNLDFYDLGQVGILHSVDILTMKEDGEKISGVTFFKTEARTCKFTFFEDSWTLGNLTDIQFIDCIGETGILRKVMKFTLNGDERVYYLQNKSINYDKKKKAFSIMGIDLLGLLLIMGAEKKGFTCTLQNSLGFTEETIEEILEIEAEIQFEIDSNAVAQETVIEDFNITHPNMGFTGEAYYDEGYPNYFPYDASIRFRFIGQLPGNEYPVVIMIDWYGSNFDQYEEDLTLNMKYFMGELTDELILHKIYSGDYSGYISKSGADSKWAMLTNGFGAYGFPETSDVEFSNSNGVYTIEDSLLKFTGTFFFDTIQLAPDEEGGDYAEIAQNEVLSGLLLLNNLYIYSAGNILYVGNKTGFTGNVIDIDNEDILEYKESSISFQFATVDLAGAFGIFLLGESLSRALEHYYRQLQAELNVKVDVEIENNYNLPMLGMFRGYGNEFSIVKRALDNDGFSYKLEGWR